MIVKILIAVAVLIVLLLIFIATRPSTFHVERSITMAAAPQNVFDRVNDLRAWGSWSPWEKKDPDMKRTFSEKSAGVGATYAWAGDGNVGEGKMTIERSDRPSAIGIRLDFFKPFAGTNQTTITFTPSAGNTTVKWAMDGRYNFVSKAFCMFMNMDKMIGNDFESALANLKAESEGTVPAAQTALAH